MNPVKGELVMRTIWLVVIILITLPAYALAQNSQTPKGAEGQASSTPSAGKPDVIEVGPKVSDGSITIVSKDERIGLIAVIAVPPSTMAKQRYTDGTPGPHLLPAFATRLKDSQFCIVRALIQIPCKSLLLRALELGFEANGKATPIACEYSTPYGEVRPINQMPGVWSGAEAYPVIIFMGSQYAYGTKLAEHRDGLSLFQKECAAEGPKNFFPFDLVYELPTGTKVAEIRFSWIKDQQDATGKATNKDVATIGKVTVTAEQTPIMQGKETLLTAKKGQAFDVSEVKGDWYGVLPSHGWIHKANVRFEPVAPGPIQKAEAPALATSADGAVPEWAKVSQLQIDSARRVGVPVTKELDLGGGVTMRLVLIPAGKFMMGDGEDRHEVTISKPFYMGVTEVTMAQYQAVMGTILNLPRSSKPMQTMTWSIATDFCKRLSDKSRQTLRLPTEAEWEYACRAGTQTAFSFGDDPSALGDYAWWARNSGDTTHPVGQKKPNPWGLYDMHGNAAECCADWYADYPKGPVTDPSGPATVTGKRVVRGGWCVMNDPRYFQCARREGLDSRSGPYGFRCAMTLP